jgi:hypothetical protein
MPGLIMPTTIKGHLKRHRQGQQSLEKAMPTMERSLECLDRQGRQPTKANGGADDGEEPGTP